MSHTPLGKLLRLFNSLDEVALPDTTRSVCKNMLRRMAEIDSTVTTSAYRELKPGEQDEPPTGDHYNQLWDAVLDEIGSLTV